MFTIRPLPHFFREGRPTPVPIVYEAGWGPASVSTGVEKKDILLSLRFEPWTYQSATSRRNAWAIPVPHICPSIH